MAVRGLPSFEGDVELARRHAEVVATGPVLSMYSGTDEASVTLDLRLSPAVTAARAVEMIEAIRADI